MKKVYILKSMLSLFFSLFIFHLANSQTLSIKSGDLTLDPDEKTTVSAEVLDKDGIAIEDAKINWSTEPGFLGKVNKEGILTADHPGEGYLIAKFHDLRDSVSLTVNGTPKIDDKDDPDDEGYPKIKIIPDNVRVEISDSVELRAFYIDSAGIKIDTVFSWRVEPTELGEFSLTTANLFYSSEDESKGMLIATLGELADTAKITIYESKAKKEAKEKEKDLANNKGKQLTIEPGDLTVYTGHEPILYSAEFKTNGVKHQDVSFFWSVSDTSISKIDENGWLTLSGITGLTLVNAEYSNFKASVELLVVDSTVDLNSNTISIRRVLPDGHELKANFFKEGESYKIGGLPYPLNILNAGMLHFPFGCIDEDIDIFIFIPEEYANYSDDSTDVNFSEDIITGVKFSVVPAGSDTIVSPYWFKVPVELKLVYKRDLLDSLGVDPHDLNVFFADNTEFVPTVEGVATVDTARNRIYASIEHFSTIVVRAKESTTQVNAIEPDPKNSFQVFPNPFTSNTNIEFKLEKASEISLSVFTIFGQKVKVLANTIMLEGNHRIQWKGDNESGVQVPNGIYLCRFVKDGELSQVKQLIISR